MKRRYEFTSQATVEDIMRNLYVHGISHVPGYLEVDKLVKLNSEFDTILTSPSASIISQADHPTNEKGRTARFSPWHESALEDFPEISTLFRTPFMREIAMNYFSPHDIELNDEVFITYEKSSQVPILPWHFDRVQSLKFWFNLTDTTAENGAFEYCPGTHWEGHYRAGFHLSQGTAVQDIPNDVDEDLIREPVTLELQAGDLLIFDPDGFHRGGIVQADKERRVLRGHTHPKKLRRYGDRPLSAGWWLNSIFNLNKWAGHASKRILGDNTQDKAINRKQNK